MELTYNQSSVSAEEVKLEICNRALSFIKSHGITSFDEKSEPAKECNLHFDIELLNLYTQFRWRFATNRTTLSKLEEDKETKSKYHPYTNGFQLPSDFLRLTYVFRPNTSTYIDDYKIFEEGVLRTFHDNVTIEYVKTINLCELPSLFRTVLSYKLAEIFSQTIKNDLGHSQMMQKNYSMNLQNLKVYITQDDGIVRRSPFASNWRGSRRSRGFKSW